MRRLVVAVLVAVGLCVLAVGPAGAQYGGNCTVAQAGVNVAQGWGIWFGVGVEGNYYIFNVTSGTVEIYNDVTEVTVTVGAGQQHTEPGDEDNSSGLRVTGVTAAVVDYVVCSGTPTPTPTGTPATPTLTPTPTPVPVLAYTSVLTLTDSERRDIGFDVDCEEIDTVSCTSSGGAWLYANGRRLCECGGACSGFYTRYPLTNTLTVFNREAVSNTVEIFLECRIYVGGMSFEMIPATPTMYPFPQLPEEPMDTLGIASIEGSGVPVPNFGESARYNAVLEYARKTINSVNKGNFLWVFAAVSMAGIVLTWAIKEVRNPRSWR